MNFISSGFKATCKGFKQAGTAVKRTIKPDLLQKIEKKGLRQDVYQKRIEKGEKYIAKTKEKLDQHTQNSKTFFNEGNWKAHKNALKSVEKAKARIAKTEAKNTHASNKKENIENRIENLKEYLGKKLECKKNLKTSYIKSQELNKKHIALSGGEKTTPEATIKKTPVSKSRDTLKKFFTGSKQNENKLLQVARRENSQLEKKLSKLDSKINKLNSGLFQDALKNAFDIVEPLQADATITVSDQSKAVEAARLAKENAPTRGFIEYVSTFGTKIRTLFNKLFSTQGASESSILSQAPVKRVKEKID